MFEIVPVEVENDNPAGSVGEIDHDVISPLIVSHRRHRCALCQ